MNITNTLKILHSIRPAPELYKKVLREWVPELSPAPSVSPTFRLAVAVLLLLFWGSGIAFAALESKPGQPLYPLKVAGMKLIRRREATIPTTTAQTPTATPLPTVTPAVPSESPSIPTPTGTPILPLLSPTVTSVPDEPNGAIKIPVELPLHIENPAPPIPIPTVKIQIETPIIGARLAL